MKAFFLFILTTSFFLHAYPNNNMKDINSRKTDLLLITLQEIEPMFCMDDDSEPSSENLKIS